MHVISASGDKLAQIDVGPRSGTYPTSTWQPGEIVVDEVGPNLPANMPAGTYMLRVGLYLQKDGQAVTAFAQDGGPPGSGSDYALLGPVMVGK